MSGCPVNWQILKEQIVASIPVSHPGDGNHLGSPTSSMKHFHRARDYLRLGQDVNLQVGAKQQGHV